MLSLLLACSGPVPIPWERPQADEVPDATESVGEGDDVEEVVGWGEPDDTGDDPPDDDPDDSWIYGLDQVHTLDVQLSLDAIAALTDDPYHYVEGAIVFDDETVESVGVRLKGASGSFQPITSKSNFKIDFNRYVEGQEFHGVEQFTVNNNVVDCSYLRETMGYRVFAAAGMPPTRTSYVWVTLNGNAKGLYTLLETPDDDWLDDHWDEPDGNLYDGKYVWAPDWSWYSRVDFLLETEMYFELEEGEDLGHADIHAVTQGLIDHWGEADAYVAMGELIDWDSFHTEFAGEVWAGHVDGYYTNNNNFRIYFDPATGLAEILPWDMDYAFYEDSDWGMNWLSPMGIVGQFCMQHADCTADALVKADEVFDRIEAAELVSVLDEATALISPYVTQDPYACGTAQTIAAYQANMRSWVTGRSPVARAQLGL